MRPPEQVGYSTDYGQGVHPLVETCRALAVVLELDKNGQISGPHLGSLAAFVPAFDAWFRHTCGLADGHERLHLLYQRELALATALPPRCWSALRPLAQACREAGLGFSMTLDLETSAAELTALAELISEGMVRGICIALPSSSALLVSEPAQQALTLLADSPLALSFTGPLRPLLDSGLLDRAAWNARHIAIDPVRPSSAANPALQHNPCWRRMRLVVDPRGDLYPCFGLLGVPSARLGHICAPLSSSVLSGRSSALHLRQLATAGPTLRGPSLPDPQAAGMPPICVQHRAELQSFAPSN